MPGCTIEADCTVHTGDGVTTIAGDIVKGLLDSTEAMNSLAQAQIPSLLAGYSPAKAGHNFSAGDHEAVRSPLSVCMRLYVWGGTYRQIQILLTPTMQLALLTAMQLIIAATQLIIIAMQLVGKAAMQLQGPVVLSG